jgi:5-methylcytosine-specific restriction enzyme A
MARLAKHPCAHPGCGALVDAGQRLCPKHRKKVERTDRERRGSARARGYDRRWERMRIDFLRQHPLCVLCLAKGITTAANVVDHIVPHRGDRKLFDDPNNLQSLCKPCHDSKTALEDGGMGRGGMRPMLHRPLTVPLLVVCGPSGSGKTSMVRECAEARDLVVDLDDILEEITKQPRYQARDKDAVSAAIRVRNTRIRRLCEDAPSFRMGWLVATGAKRIDRDHWRTAGAHVVLVSTPLTECLRRIRSDATRTDKAAHERWATQWHATFEPDPQHDRWVRDAAELRASASRALE